MRLIYSKILDFNLNSQFLFFIFLFILFSYSYQSLLPAYNADDVIQLQEISNDSYTFLGSGRWGYFFIFKYVLQASSGGLFATFFGSLFLIFSSLISSKIIGFRKDISKFLFVVVSSVSIYYGFLFAFDSTRLIYPIAVFLAILGFYFSHKNRFFLSVFMIAFSLSFYQPSIQVVSTIFFVTVMYRVINNDKEKIWIYFIVKSFVIFFSMVVYFFLTKIMYFFVGFELTDRVSVNLLSFLNNYESLFKIFSRFVIPFFYKRGSYYIDWQIVYPLFFILVSFFVSLFFIKIKNIFVVFLFFFLSALSPFALAFISNELFFPVRSLISISSLHAAWLAITVDILLTRDIKFEQIKPIFVNVLVIVGLFFASMHSMQINKKALDDFFVSQEDLLATNRIIARIELVAAQQIIENPLKKIPLTVIYDQAIPAGPRGDVGTARTAPWSKEWIFRLIDNRYVIADKLTQEKAIQQAQSVPVWPSSESVFLLEDGSVVVKIN